MHQDSVRLPYTFLPTLSALFCMLFLPACTRQTDQSDSQLSPGKTLFEQVAPEDTGLVFTNELSTGEDFDVFRYRNYYNGGGVAIGDVNNDGLADIYLSANSAPNRLFINRGEWVFDDVTEAAGVAGSKGWSTGVAMVDLNADGLLDIYVCNSGNLAGDNKANELFINNGDGTFTESARQYGLADEGFGTHGVFFDYDRDGDLDCYLLNNSFRPVGTLGYKNLRKRRDQQGGDRLLRNNNGHFDDVSDEAGIYGSVIGFGLGVTVGDINLDGWLDIYVSNDFYERDYLYVNQGDGTFSEELEQHINSISLSSMGADMADLTNDGLPELFVTDMLPKEMARLKRTSTFQSWDVYQIRLQNDYYHQFMRNTLQLNIGGGHFAEIGQLAGVEATDWSWGALLADYDNDGLRDILVCNGVYKDVTDQDYVNYLANDENISAAQRGEAIDFERFINLMPSYRQPNAVYTRDSLAEMPFRNLSVEWGLSEPSFSNGAAYGDLDNDGDLDLVINNVNQPLSVYKNRSDRKKALRLQFRGLGKNTQAIGARVEVHRGPEVLSYEHMPMRGFQSSMDYTAIIGLGTRTHWDSLVINWPNGSSEVLNDLVWADSTVVLQQPAEFGKAGQVPKKAAATGLYFASAALIDSAVPHQENEFSDFDTDKMSYFMVSAEGPAASVADINEDGVDDLYLGGAAGQAGQLLLGDQGGGFKFVSSEVFANHAQYEDVDATFIDVDQDGDLDLYVVSGGIEFKGDTRKLQDRLYLNMGGGRFSDATDHLPEIDAVGSCVAGADMDADGDIDLFIGTRVVPNSYGNPAESLLLINDGSGHYSFADFSAAKALRKLGMVTDAVWKKGSGAYPDLVVVGHYMPVTILSNEGGRLTNKPRHAGDLSDRSGWWSRVEVEDMNGDGREDLILGNFGLNNKFHVSRDKPLELFIKDFDRNGTLEHIFTYRRGEENIPLVLRHDLVKQLPGLSKKYLTYEDYAQASLKDLFSKEDLEEAAKLSINELRSGIAYATNGGYRFAPLPWQGQVSPVMGQVLLDVDQDGDTDLIVGGNFYRAKPEAGRQDASYGALFLNDGSGNMRAVSNQEGGLYLTGEVRRLLLVTHDSGSHSLVAARNSDAPLIVPITDPNL